MDELSVCRVKSFHGDDNTLPRPKVLRKCCLLPSRA